MGNLKAEMFNRKASNPKSKPYEVIEILSIKKGESILDVGSGGGFFTFLFAEKVGDNGIVYASDTNKEFLDYIEETKSSKGISNIKTIYISEGIPEISEESIDLIFMRNVYHHLKNRVEYFSELKKVLKPKGRVTIIDYVRNKGFSFHRMMGHSTGKGTTIEDLESSGFKLIKDANILPEQNFLIFQLKNK
ncbi:MAG: methyltransferase domain-containing protein [Methanofastidiosum sp.]|nr:methyltransferase domain-containing protein [Methanofastidiosum sp.]